ncbi:MAG: superoxide dismutase family protein [Planctomycetota bacterium]|nr:superoxide dismutase family protein [Planctomycetota bacterium]
MKYLVSCLMALVLVAAGFGLAGQFSNVGATAQEAKKQEKKKNQRKNPWQGVRDAVAVLTPTKGNKAHGKVSFNFRRRQMTVVAHIEGLEPNSKHAIHIHQFGDISMSDGKGTGGHYNPEMHDHGLPEKNMRHAGDLGNLQADARGVAHYEITVDNLAIAGRKNPIIGRGVIVHAKPDDGGQPTGNAGARIAQGVIGVAQGNR